MGKPFATPEPIEALTPDVPLVRSIHPTGSRYICSPPVITTDIDFVVLVEDLDQCAEKLEAEGWHVNLDDPEYDIAGEIEFLTARRGDYNLILYDRDEGYEAFVAATEVAKKLNLTEKEDRIKLFQAVCGGRLGL